MINVKSLKARQLNAVQLLAVGTPSIFSGRKAGGIYHDNLPLAETPSF